MHYQLENSSKLNCT